MEFFPAEVEFDGEHDRLFLIERPGRWPPVTARDQREAERAFRRSEQCWASGRIEVRPQEAREEVDCLLHP